MNNENIMDLIRKNWAMLMVVVSLIYGWSSIQFDIQAVKANIASMGVDLNYTKSMYYSVENKITELQVEVKNLNKSVDSLVVELKKK